MDFRAICPMRLMREGDLLQVFQKGHDERPLREEYSRHPLDDGRRLIGKRNLKVAFSDQLRCIQLLQDLGDALGLRAGKASLF